MWSVTALFGVKQWAREEMPVPGETNVPSQSHVEKFPKQRPIAFVTLSPEQNCNLCHTNI